MGLAVKAMLIAGIELCAVCVLFQHTRLVDIALLREDTDDGEVAAAEHAFGEFAVGRRPHVRIVVQHEYVDPRPEQASHEQAGQKDPGAVSHDGLRIRFEQRLEHVKSKSTNFGHRKTTPSTIASAPPLS